MEALEILKYAKDPILMIVVLWFSHNALTKRFEDMRSSVEKRIDRLERDYFERSNRRG